MDLPATGSRKRPSNSLMNWLVETQKPVPLAVWSVSGIRKKKKGETKYADETLIRKL